MSRLNGMVCVLFRTRLTKNASYFSSYILFILFINFRTDRDRFDPTLSKFDRTRFFAVVLHLNVSSGEIKVRQNTHVIPLSGFSHKLFAVLLRKLTNFVMIKTVMMMMMIMILMIKTMMMVTMRTVLIIMMTPYSCSDSFCF